MKLTEFGVGKITAQNTTKDVKPGETERQAKKLGLGGKPKLLHKTAAKNSDPNTLMNLGIGESAKRVDEVNMSPGALKSWADSDEAKDVTAGFELEMIFKDTESYDLDDPEPDYEHYNEPVRDRDAEDVYKFFDNGQYPISGYMNYNQFLDLVNDTEGYGLMDMEDFWKKVIGDGGNHSDGIWFDDIADLYDIRWPYYTNEGSGERNQVDIAKKLEGKLKKFGNFKVFVSGNYRSGSRNDAIFVFEPDNSIKTDFKEDTGVEIISPPMPLGQAIEVLDFMFDWAKSDEAKAYTNDSTGLHMNISVANTGNTTDYVKLALFTGDNYILEKYGRMQNSYTKSAFDLLKQNASDIAENPKYIKQALVKMHENLQSAAKEFILGDIGQDKYTSIHIKPNYIEFRSPGGDYLDMDKNQIISTMLRFSRAMSIANNPDAYRKEYQKKLYKLITTDAESKEGKFNQLFADFQSGKIDDYALKRNWYNLVSATGGANPNASIKRADFAKKLSTKQVTNVADPNKPGKIIYNITVQFPKGENDSFPPRQVTGNFEHKPGLSWKESLETYLRNIYKNENYDSPNFKIDWKLSDIFFMPADRKPLKQRITIESLQELSESTSSVDDKQMEKWIRDAARARGIDPDVAVRVWRSEGGTAYQSRIPRKGQGSDGGYEASYGPFQLYTGGGLGNEYQDTYGVDLRKDNTPDGIKRQIDFALDKAAKGGWSPWYGAANVGIKPYQGIGDKPMYEPIDMNKNRSVPVPKSKPQEPVKPKADNDFMQRLYRAQNLEVPSIFKATASSNDLFGVKPRKVSTVSKSDDQSFASAFAAARKRAGGAGGKFTWQGKEYQTNIKGEKYVSNPVSVDEAEEVVPMLYHATYRPFLDSIMKNGLGGKGAQTQWEDSKPGYVYLAKDPEVAVSHAEANEEVPDEYIDDIVVLSIDASQLDQNNLEDDPNVMDDDSTLAYKGIIPVSAFSVMESLQELRIEKPDPKDTLGIERKFMPQIKSDDYQEFIDFLTQNGAKFRQETIPASELRAMQKQFSDKGILKQLEKNIAKGPNTKAVIASSDDYILDGHHRWLVAVNTGDDLNVYRVNMPAWRLYDLVNQFEKVYYKDIYDEGKPSIGVPLSSGLVVSIFPHRPLKIKPSTPGKLRYDENNSSIGSQINFPGFKKNEKPKPKPKKYNPIPKKDQGVLDKIKGFFEGKGINEAYMLRLENTDDQLVLHVKNTKTGERMEVRGKPNYEIDYDPNDELHQLLDVIGKASNISELMNGEVVNVNPKHPDGPRSYKALHDLMHEDLYNWFKEKWGVEEGAEITMWTNPEYQGSDVDDEYYNKQPAKLIDVNKLTPFEPADKMHDEISAANMNKLVKAIQAGKKINPVVITKHQGKWLIIDGHHRYFAHLKAGVDKIRVVVADPKDLTWRDDVPDETATLSQEDILQLKGTDKFTKSSKPGKHFSPHPARGMLVGIKTNEAPTARDSMNLDADKLQQSIDYFYTTHAPKNFGSARTEGNFKGLKVVTFTKGGDTLMFLVDNTDQAVFYVMYSKFDDGVAIGNVRSNGTVKATEVYAYLVDKFGTLYSDDSQTPQGRKIWASLAKFYPNLDVKDTGGRFVATKKTQVDEGVNDPHIFKAVFLAGGPGSGKTFVAQALLGGTGLKKMNSDDVYEILMKKQDLALDPDTIASPQGQEIRDKAKLITKRRSANWIDGRLGLLIDGTGKDVAKYQKQAEFLRMLGYDVAMIFVNTSEEVAQQRNRQRARSLPRDMVSTMWNEVQQNLMKFQQLMGAGRFHIIDNSGGLEDLDRQKNFDKAYNELQRFLNTPPSKRAALAWIQQQKEQNDEKRSAIQQQNQQSDGGTSATN